MAHHLVHIMRKHADFLPELSLVAELVGLVIGNIMYTKAMGTYAHRLCAVFAQTA